MKYKILSSIAHNFTASFVSYMNYVDEGYVIDDVLLLAREAHGERISIQWIPSHQYTEGFPRRVLNSIKRYREWLPTLVESSGARVEAIRELRTDIFVASNKQIIVEAYLLDDRGKEYVSRVYF